MKSRLFLFSLIVCTAPLCAMQDGPLVNNNWKKLYEDPRGFAADWGKQFSTSVEDCLRKESSSKPDVCVAEGQRAKPWFRAKSDGERHRVLQQQNSLQVPPAIRRPKKTSSASHRTAQRSPSQALAFVQPVVAIAPRRAPSGQRCGGACCPSPVLPPSWLQVAPDTRRPDTRRSGYYCVQVLPVVFVPIRWKRRLPPKGMRLLAPRRAAVQVGAHASAAMALMLFHQKKQPEPPKPC